MVPKGLIIFAVVVAIAVNVICQNCPQRYPYSYFSGAYCCQFRYEKPAYENRIVQDAGCDGGDIGASSECCYQNEFVACPAGSGCGDNNQTGGNCSMNFPYAYWHGEYCCATGMEKPVFDIRMPQGVSCNGSVLGIDSLCCQNDSFWTCSSPPCTNYNNIPYLTLP